MGAMDWIDLTQDGVQWWSLVNTVMILLISMRRDFLCSMELVT